ncbi:MAG TPA: 2-ketoglutarate oxidoreductase subunit delta [Desulfobacterales bacterium]|nr:2-ketoglutarate oxidoreductase subunit delta [Desulfobacterales bacterium]
MVKKTKPDARQSKKAVAAPKPKAKTKTKKKERKPYDVGFFHKWCKACGLCGAFCTKKIIKYDEAGLPFIKEMDSCIGCRFCEIHCPDFAITIKERHPQRRNKNGKS